MTISMTRYVNIVSGVGGGAGVRSRELILRIISNNSVIPPNSIYEFSNIESVGEVFGLDSPEYARATPYFAFISKSIGKPRKIAFSRYLATAVAPIISGDSVPKILTNFTSQTAATLRLVIDGAVTNVPAIDLSAATTLTNVATLIQTAIRAIVAAPQLATASVTYNASTNQFTFMGTVVGSGVISCVNSGLPTDISVALGWSTSAAVASPGLPADTPLTAVVRMAGISSNFGSFLFQIATQPTLVELTPVSAWNDTQNNKYMYCVPCTAALIGSYYTALKGFSGTGVTIVSSLNGTDFSEQCPAEILAATNYSLPNSTQGYMYYQFPSRVPTIASDIDADLMDASRGNYIGSTETAGQDLSFYQRGVLMGGSQAAVDMNVYANEMWFKDDIAVKLMSMFLNSPRVPANLQGRGQVMTTIQVSIDSAKLNGTISPGKALNNDQKSFITTVTNNPRAWRQVESVGYYLDVQFQSIITTDSRTEWVAVYTLVYGKDDAIRKIEGTNNLI